MAKLTDKLIQALPVPEKGNARVPDSEVKGLKIRVSANGDRAFELRYRVAGVERLFTIGSCADWSLGTARSEAKRLKRLVDQGVDPKAERDQAREAPTVAHLLDRYLAEHVEVHNKPRTQAEVRRMVANILKPRLGRMKVADVEHEDIARLHRELKRTPRQANHVVAILSKVFNLAEVWRDDGGAKLRPLNSNPCRHLKRYPENARTRYPKLDELSRIGQVMTAMQAEGRLRPEVANAIRFLALSGARLSAGVGLELGAVDFKTGEWTLERADNKTGARIAVIGSAALALLASLGRDKGRAFVSATGKPVTANAVERAWIGEKPQPKHRKPGRPGIRDRAEVPDLRVHDLRHGLGTHAGAAQFNAFVIRDLLGHSTLAMAGKYVNRHVDPVRAAADDVSGKIAAALDRAPDARDAEVVEMRERRA